MSRWRETLCGKAIQPDPSLEDKSLLASGQSQVLTCGGKFLPQNPNPASPKRGLPTFIHLPKDDYEVLFCNPRDLQSPTCRSTDVRESMTDELDVIEAALSQFDSKVGK